MNSEPSRVTKLPRRFRWYVPALFVGWLAGMGWVAFGVWFYLLFVSIFHSTARLPGVHPLLSVVIGLVGGLAVVALERWRVSRNLEAEARAVAFRERSFRRVALAVLPLMAIYVATFGILYLYSLETPAAGMTFPLAIGSLFTPYVFLYHAYSRVYDRARQLLAEASATAQEEPSSQARSSRTGTWLNALGVVSIIGVLAVGVWLQWGVAYLAQREPKEYVTETQPGGRAVRLTYGADAGAPAISPDGRLVAYVREVGLWQGRLEIMDADGRNKRRIGADTGPSPWSVSRPPVWAPDRSRILLAATQGWVAVFPPEPIEDTLREDLWVVDVTTGAADRLTKDGGFISGIWLPAVHKIAALKDAGKKKGARLWLMDEDGHNRQEVARLKLPRASSAVQPWRDGREVVAVGRDESTGIWSVDAASGRATRVSDLKSYWAIPLDANRLVIATPGHAYPPVPRATSIGILDAATGDVHWVLRDIQGVVRSPCLAGKAPALVFRLSLDQGTDLWAMRLRDGKLHRLTRGESVWSLAVDPSGTQVFYAAHVEDDGHWLTSLMGLAIWRLTPGRPLASW
jgi:Tol biopolymer transport system component